MGIGKEIYEPIGKLNGRYVSLIKITPEKMAELLAKRGLNPDGTPIKQDSSEATDASSVDSTN